MLGMVGGAMFFARRKSDEIGTARRLLILLACSAATIGAAGLVPQVGWMVPLWLIGGVSNGGENVNIGVMLGPRARRRGCVRHTGRGRDGAGRGLRLSSGT